RAIGGPRGPTRFPRLRVAATFGVAYEGSPPPLPACRVRRGGARRSLVLRLWPQAQAGPTARALSGAFGRAGRLGRAQRLGLAPHLGLGLGRARGQGVRPV